MKFRIKKYVYSGMFLAVLLLSHSAQDVYGKKKNLQTGGSPRKMITTDFTSREINHI